MTKLNLKQKAIQLRVKGFTYSEIKKVIPVAKSTISLWLREVNLTVRQKQKITEKSRQGQRKGALAQRNKRIRKQLDLIRNAQKEIGSLTKRELWLIGIALYWAEGGKEKDYNPGCQTSLSNSDPKMIALFVLWLKKCIKISDKDMYADLYIHESRKEDIENIIAVWSKSLGKQRSFFRAVYYKKNKIGTKRNNIGILYIGLVRVTIRASSDLNRKITGWIKGITNYWGIV